MEAALRTGGDLSRLERQNKPSTQKGGNSPRPIPKKSPPPRLPAVITGSSSGKPFTPRNKPRFSRISDSEKASLKAAGKCFICKEKGHLARNCPDKSKTGKNREGQNIRSTTGNSEPITQIAETSTADLTAARAAYEKLSNSDVEEFLSIAEEEGF